MRCYQKEFNERVAFIRKTVQSAGAKGVAFGNSGGKDCVLVGILCKAACPNTIGVIMPCASRRNYNEDKEHAEIFAERFGIENKLVDLTDAWNYIVNELDLSNAVLGSALADPTHTIPANIAPRLRMTALYAIAASRNLLVAGTGNRSERHMGYFTKWGDGAYDFNPIADLTASEVFEFLRFLNAPDIIIEKAPSAGLFDGQTDETEMGISYKEIDEYLLHGTATDEKKALIEQFHEKTMHKRKMPPTYNKESL
ncbi:MAG: NAD(+) synthase [Oscillospiraceae bacterium]|jgi:NAD+ synthase|nr:NAD(+) synthase [Oscillospiraceae bacterium]